MRLITRGTPAKQGSFGPLWLEQHARRACCSSQRGPKLPCLAGVPRVIRRIPTLPHAGDALSVASLYADFSAPCRARLLCGGAVGRGTPMGVDRRFARLLRLV